MSGDALAALVAEELRQPVTPGAAALTAAVRARHGAAVKAVVFYGSCLRDSEDRDRVLDLYVLVERYRDLYPRRWLAVLNALLPPNVFYVEVPAAGGTVRAKYAVVSLADFARANSPRCFHPYFWARFAQPCALVYAETPAVAERVVRAVAGAVVTFVQRVAPLLPAHVSVAELWTTGLRATYATELRSERADAARRLFDAAPERYARATAAVGDALPFAVRMQSDGSVDLAAPESARRWAPAAWMMRRALGKVLSVLRIGKGALTFEGGVDYVLWKIERHSGVAIDPSWRSQRHPLLGLGAAAWRLYRQGAFR